MVEEPRLAKPGGRIFLDFEGRKAVKIAGSLAGIEQIGASLWIGGDELTTVERLAPSGAGRYARHHSFSLKVMFDLPGKASEEVDLEGLSYDDSTGRLWMLGSHSLRPGKPCKKMTPRDARRALRHNKTPQQNRYLLGYVEIRGAAELDAASIARPDRDNARRFSIDEDGGELMGLLRKDKLLAPYLTIPSKDNGFDIEGLAVKDGVVRLGLRGPVVNGWASILQLRPRKHGDSGLKLERAPNGRHGYMHHILDLDGLGIRDLAVMDDDLLILAGPTMAMDGPFRVFRWIGGATMEQAAYVQRADEEIECLYDIPCGYRQEHPEGMTLYRRPGHELCLLIVNGGPADRRLKAPDHFEALLFDLV